MSKSNKLETIVYIRPSGREIEVAKNKDTKAYAEDNDWLTEAQAEAEAEAKSSKKA